MSYVASAHAKAIELCRLALEMTAEAGSGHPTSAMSLAHVTTVLYYDHLRHDPADPGSRAADRVVLSEGHACPIIYAAAADLGIEFGVSSGSRRKMTRDDALDLRSIDSEIDGHPNPEEGFPLFPASTGSLGQGLSVAAGMALADRLDGIQKNVYCIIGDGESREGQVWEAVDFLVDQSLHAVCPIFNCNRHGQTGPVSDQQSPDVLAAKLQAYGLDPRVIDGHDPEALRDALTAHATHPAEARPVALVLKTVKGWGAPSLQGGGKHGKPATGDDYDRAIAELDETARELDAAWTEGDLRVRSPEPVRDTDPSANAESAVAVPPIREMLGQINGDELDEASELSVRKACGAALRALGHQRPDVVVLDGDVGNSTYTEYFGDDPYLESRFFQCRIAEQHMISCAAGLAASGKTAFASSFGKFLGRTYDQLEMALLGGFPLKVIGSHVGVSLGADGPSQMALTDAAYFRSLSTVYDRDGGRLMHVLTPADAVASYALTVAMAEHPGACYLRTMRPSVPLLYGEDASFQPGGHRVLSDGRDLMVVAWGYMVHEAKRAAAQLAEHGVDITLVDLYSVPFNEVEIAQLAEACGRRVLCVDDSYGGGLGAAVADALLTTRLGFSFESMSVRGFPKSGRGADEVLEYLGLSAGDIAEAALRLLGREQAP